VEQAIKAIDSARIEAECIPNGVGIVKLMGRSAGFIAAHATLADRNVDICLIPEIPIDLHGPEGVLTQVENALKAMGHCVIVVAEGAGETLIKDELTGSDKVQKDESGNPRFPPIGEFLKEAIERHFKSKGIVANVK
jgi:6-phosphofructokinase 1